MVDYYSTFFKVAILGKTTSAEVIKAVCPMFARFGIPHSLRTDNGPQFVSDEFEKFLTTNGIEHRKNTSLWPQVNSEVEHQNRSLLKCLQIAQVASRIVHIPNGLQIYATGYHWDHTLFHDVQP